MVERAQLLVLVKRMGYRQTARWVEKHPVVVEGNSSSFSIFGMFQYCLQDPEHWSHSYS
jgi:hypothetical protein